MWFNQGTKQNMKIPKNENCSDASHYGKAAANIAVETPRHLGRSFKHGARRSLAISCRIFICGFILASFPVLRVAGQSAQQWKLPDIPWAFPIRDKVQPVIDERKGPQHVPGRARRTPRIRSTICKIPRIGFRTNMPPCPKWLRTERAAACLDALPATWLQDSAIRSRPILPAFRLHILRQLADFKAKNRMGEAMNDMTENLSDEDARQASEWFRR